MRESGLHKAGGCVRPQEVRAPKSRCLGLPFNVQAAHEAQERKEARGMKTSKRDFKEVSGLSFARRFRLGEGAGSLTRLFALKRGLVPWWLPEACFEPAFPRFDR